MKTFILYFQKNYSIVSCQSSHPSPDARVKECIYTKSVEHAVKECDVAIDFTSPKNSIQVAEACAIHKKALVIGTTGFNDKELQIIEEISKKTPTFLSYNMSIGITTLQILISQAARTLGNGYEIQIKETHHKHKKDTPSGTAIMLKEALQNNSIKITSSRLDEVVGEHNVVFKGESEILELKHMAINRTLFAQGAFKAASYIVKQKPGKIYNMQDLIKQQ